MVDINYGFALLLLCFQGHIAIRCFSFFSMVYFRIKMRVTLKKGPTSFLIRFRNY